MHSYSGLQQMFTNVVYLGHWVKKGVILYYHNHEALVSEDDFTCAFNALSYVDFQDDPNPNYMPQRLFVWHDKAKRGSDFDFQRGAKRVFWSQEELNQMRGMVETAVPQWQIMKTFPDCNWNVIVLLVSQAQEGRSRPARCAPLPL